LTRYQTSLALDQVEYNGTAESDGSTFNIKYVESRESMDLSENKRDKKDSNDKLSEGKSERIQLGSAAVGLLHSSIFFLYLCILYDTFHSNHTALL